ncbi:Leucine-rich_repeat domain superfamily [Hexamita inflata]|uniref:Leucine-rich repeat domain superfamily n=1 Tax=Hexamita inflata TaxID=28002 RepID=A0AA86PW99_9EUKA|nr:Leucine-rich repeat domain superfamily [Hexamita inflata]
MFKYTIDYEGISIKHEDGEKPYDDKILQLNTQYKEIYIEGKNSITGVKESFSIPKFQYPVNLILYQCTVDLSQIQGNFGEISLKRCEIKGSLSDGLSAQSISASVYDQEDFKFSQLSQGKFQKINIGLYSTNDADFSGASKLYGRLGTLSFNYKCFVNLAKLEGYWDCVDLSNCTFSNNIQSNKFGANKLEIYRGTPFNFINQFQNCTVNVLDLAYRSVGDNQFFKFNNPNIYSFAQTKMLFIQNFQIDLSKLSGSFQKLELRGCTLQGNSTQNLVVDQLAINYCNITAQQLSSFSCRFLELERDDDYDPITELPQQLQKLYIYGNSLKLKNLKQYPRLSEIELQDCQVENISFINVPNIKSIKLDGCKPSKSTHGLQNIIKRKKKNDAKLVELKKELLLTKIQNQERRRKLGALKTELAQILQLDVSQITVGRE